MTAHKSAKDAEISVAPVVAEAEGVPTDAHTHAHTDGPAQPSLAGLNVHQRLNVARQTLRGRAFTKDQSNRQFSSVSIDSMRNAVQEAIIAAGLNLVLVDKSFQLTSSGPTRTFLGTARMRVINADDPEDFVEYMTESYANDNGDKGLSKWDTGLLKTAYKEIFQIGERGKDDIDSYSNEELEEEAERIEAMRARRKEKASKDPFFGDHKPDPLTDLRRTIGQLMQDHAGVVLRYKSQHGTVPEWDEATLKACIAECAGQREGGQ